MNTNARQKQKGFTIIEVVLVLAIAGLIFLIVFLALPQLQKSRRDTQRKNDVGRVLSALENYASNNNGDYPVNQAEFTSFGTNYLNSMNDPSTGSAYTTTYATGTPPNKNTIYYSRSTNCSGGAVTALGSTNNRQIAVAIGLETGGSYCQSN